MVFKIRHEKKWLQIVPLLLFVFSLVPLLAFAFNGKFTVLMWILLIIMNTSMVMGIVLYFMEQRIGTSLVVESDHILIKHIFERKEIKTDDICDVQIERYERHRRKGKHYHYREQRMRMTIYLNSGEEYVLTDKATILHYNPFSIASAHFAQTEYLPDDEVPLYMAYTVIKSTMG